MQNKREYQIAQAAAGAHGMLKVLVEFGGIDACHRPQAIRIVNELAEAIWTDPEPWKWSETDEQNANL